MVPGAVAAYHLAPTRACLANGAGPASCDATRCARGAPARAGWRLAGGRPRRRRRRRARRAAPTAGGAGAISTSTFGKTRAARASRNGRRNARDQHFYMAGSAGILPTYVCTAPYCAGTQTKSRRLASNNFGVLLKIMATFILAKI